MKFSHITLVKHARRTWLKQAGALAGAASLPLLGVSAFTFAQSKLNGLPRIALVMGNTRYRDAPLKNPVNDAKAIANELQQTGFRVSLQLDAGRAQMSGAIQSFTDDLAKTKGVGLFYYAGHGAQLAWRNYLIPVDAVIEKLEDMREKTVELNSLLQGLIAAKNPMNIIILDACRDNPFGTKVPTEAKGLSQFDAPPGSLLAYATSPGNTAGDGEGANGLYTENLLRELKIPETKIEDVFKRVRLSVRRRSEGQQIPWESTSLEDDFYFLPPKELKKLSEDELEKQFELELGIWDKIKSSKEREPLENYLRQFPSGKFSELAQFRLDRLLAESEKNRINSDILANQASEEKLKLARAAEEKRQADVKRIAEERRLAEEKRVVEEKRLLEERRLAEEKRHLEEQRISKLEAQKRIAEETRIAAELKATEARRHEEEIRLAAERKYAEDKRIAEEKLLSEETRLARIEIEKRKQSQPSSTAIPAGPNPYSKGTARVDFNYQVGDSYTYQVLDVYSKATQNTLTETVTTISDTEIVYNNGKTITDFLGNYIKDNYGRGLTSSQYFVADYSMGKKWTTRFRLIRVNGTIDEVELNFKVIGVENITVPAGTFDAFKVEGQGFVGTAGANWKYIYWIAPKNVRRFVAMEYTNRSRGGRTTRAERYELVSFKQS